MEGRGPTEFPCPLCALGGHSKKSAVCNQEDGSEKNPAHAGTLISGFPASRIMSDTPLMSISHPVYRISYSSWNKDMSLILDLADLSGSLGSGV